MSVTFVFPGLSYSFSRTCRFGGRAAAAGHADLALPGEPATGSRGKKFHDFSAFRRRRLPRADGPEGRPVAVRHLRSPASVPPRRRPAFEQILQDGAGKPGAAPAAAPDRPCRIAPRAVPAPLARSADPPAR